MRCCVYVHDGCVQRAAQLQAAGARERELEAALAELTTRAESLQGKLQGETLTVTAVQELEDRVRELSTTKDTLDKQLAEIQTSNAALQAVVSQATAAKEDLQAQLAASQDTATQLEAAVGALQEQVNSLTADLAAAQDMVRDNWGAVRSRRTMDVVTLKAHCGACFSSFMCCRLPPRSGNTSNRRQAREPW